MKLTIRSISDVVARNIQALAEQSGTTVTDDAETILVHTVDSLQLQRGGSVTPLPYPIHPNDLFAALHAPISAAAAVTYPLINGWIFEPVLRSITSPHETISLTEKEALLLSALLATMPTAIPRESLLRKVWSFEPNIETHTLETHIYRLRQKLEALHPSPCAIETLDGSYRLVLPLVR